ncbi:hypothetical protein OPV22_000575 [Ensete ventricosum]|uniref:Uncharacterized protein n=1 Tax=Ensete ventricosum TaxID=4639 RepID=A0AAV8Q9R4_ENSVE|nr:hypothetical protein OPV22_000575 [Ensete ventricosum]
MVVDKIHLFLVQVMKDNTSALIPAILLLKAAMPKRQKLNIPYYMKNLPLDATPAQLEEEAKKHGPVRPDGLQVRSNKGGLYAVFVASSGGLQVLPINSGSLAGKEDFLRQEACQEVQEAPERKGIDSRVRRKFNGFLVHNVAELELLMMHNRTSGAEIAHNVSTRNLHLFPTSWQAVYNMFRVLSIVSKPGFMVKAG